jgi:hypothetical protein
MLMDEVGKDNLSIPAGSMEFSDLLDFDMLLMHLACYLMICQADQIDRTIFLDL